MTKELKVKATVENIGRVTEFVEEQLDMYECPIKIAMQIDVAIDELVSNIANYSYPDGEGDLTLEVEVADNPRRVELTFIDSGVPYNPLDREDPDITLSAEERAIGGLGIYIVKKTMDDITYQYENGCNILCVSKFF